MSRDRRQAGDGLRTNDARTGGPKSAISKKRLAEERLRESEERYRRIVETANEGICVIDDRGIMMFVNRQLCAMLGYDEAEVIGRSIFDYFTPAEKSAAEGHLRDLLQRERVQADFKSHRKDGTEMWLLVAGNALFDKQGRYAGALGMVTDITERKHAEEAARAYTDRLNLLRQVEEGILRAESPEAVAEFVLEHLQNLAPFERASIALFDHERKEIHEIATYTGGARVPGTREPFASYGSAMDNMAAVGRGEIVVVDTERYAKESAVIAAAFENGVKYAASVPLIAGGDLIGCLCLGTSTPDSFPAEVLEIAREMAGPLAISIRQARLLEVERRRSTELARANTLMAALGRVAARLQASLDPQQVMDTLGAELKALEVNIGVGLLDPDELCLLMRYATVDIGELERLDRAAGGAHPFFHIPLKRVPVIADLFARRTPLYVPDALPLASELLTHLTPPAVEYGIQSLGLTPGSGAMLLPLKVEERMLGVLGVVGRDVRATDVPAFSVLASQVAVAMENARLFEELRDTQGRLQTLSRRLVEVHETERRALARELHDEIGQLLTGLKLSLETCMRTATDGIRTRLAEAVALGAELLERVRKLSLDLRPAMLDDLGLIPTLLWHLGQFQERTNVRVTLQHAGLECRLHPEIETATYRIIQEALTNVARHAGAEEATVRVWNDGGTVHLQVEDRGRGFDVKEALAAGTSSGLLGMRERTIALGGHLSLASQPGDGTTVAAELPLRGPAAAAQQEERNDLDRARR